MKHTTAVENMVAEDGQAGCRAVDEHDRSLIQNRLLDLSPDAITARDMEDRITYWSRGAEEMYGYSSEEAVGSSIRELLKTVFPEPVEEVFAKVHRDNRWSGDLQHTCKDGSRLIVLSRWALDRDAQGRPSAILEINSDVTQHRRTEHALQESEQRLRLALEASRSVSWEWDVETGLLSWSGDVRALFGRPAEEMREFEKANLTVHPDDRAVIERAAKEALDGDGHYSVEFRTVLPDGRVRWLVGRGRVLRDEAGRSTRLIGANMDITELKTAQEELRQSRDRLEQRVTERTHELTQANERLKEVDRLKSQFLATMSHELRTPLNSIIGFTEIIHGGLTGPLNEEQKKQLGMVLNSARHLLTLITDLLDLARIESGRGEPLCEWMDLRGVIEQVLQTLGPIAAQKGLSIQTEFNGDLRMFSDRKMAFQIVLNLANNAVKFTERGHVRIAAERHGGQIKIAVADTGVGIKPEDMLHLFTAFRQMDGSARRRFEGTGLGLYLSQKLAKLLGGEIKAESALGQGSTFTAILPAVSAKEAQNESTSVVDRGQ